MLGSTCADVLSYKELCETLVLLDIKEGVAEGKALDIFQKSAINSYDTRTNGVTSDYKATSNSDVVVITSGFPRKPGMSRDDLIAMNANIVTTVTDNILKYSPDAILIIVSNPLDVMTYASHLRSGKSRYQVIGMAGILDTARYKAFLADALKVSVKDIQSMILGGHGDTMVPLPRYTSVSGIPVSELISTEVLDGIIERTKYGGGELVKLMGTSAWYAPGAAAAQMVEAILKNQRRSIPCLR